MSGPTDAQVRKYIRQRAHELHAEVAAMGHTAQWDGDSAKPTRSLWFYLRGYGGVRIALSPTVVPRGTAKTLRWDAILTCPSGIRVVKALQGTLKETVLSLLYSAKSAPSTLGAHGASIEE
jgi:hypothetical protein